MYKGNAKAVSWANSSGAARFAEELLQGNTPENMPLGTLVFISDPLKQNIGRIIISMGKATQ